MNMRRPNFHRQRGDALVAALIAVLLFHVVGYVLMDLKRNVKEKRYYEAEAMGLLHMQSALTQYARANQVAFRTGKTVMYVNDQLAPTIPELRSLGFLSQSGPEVMAPWGRTFATTLTVKGTGAIEGAVYLTGSIVDQFGNPDRLRACNVAKALGSIGLCTPPTNAAALGNRTIQIPNPTGAPAAVGALVFVAP
jgi:hypothetical protein